MPGLDPGTQASGWLGFRLGPRVNPRIKSGDGDEGMEKGVRPARAPQPIPDQPPAVRGDAAGAPFANACNEIKP